MEERRTRHAAWVDAADIFADRAAQLRRANTPMSLTMADTYAAARPPAPPRSADAHPDRGGTDAELLATHARYIEARCALTAR